MAITGGDTLGGAGGYASEGAFRLLTFVCIIRVREPAENKNIN